MASIFNGIYVKLLKDQLKLNNTASILTGTSSPMVVATDAPAGSIYLQTGSANLLYQKQDGGLTTNWLPVGSGLIVEYLDAASTTLPNVGMTSVTFDNGNAAVNGDLILFTALNANNNSIYQISGVGTSIQYTLMTTFSSNSAGKAVRFSKGSAYINQEAVFNGTSFIINDVLRLFNSGVNNQDFVEASSIKTTTLPLSTSDFVVFSVNAIGSNNILVNYSLSGTFGKVIGQLMITQDGTNIAIADSNATVGDSLVTFSADLNAGNVELTATNADTANIQMKYFVWRWSDTNGGPTGIPNYTGAINSSSVVAAGATGDVQFKGVSGNLDADPNFSWDSVNGTIDLNGYKVGIQSTFPILDNQSIPQVIMSFPANTNRWMHIQYGIERDVGNGHTDTQIGRIMLVSNSVFSSLTDESTHTDVLGITFSTNVAAGIVYMYYVSTNVGNPATLKYQITSWN